MRALRSWAAKLAADGFPERLEIEQNPLYWNEKIPTDSRLLEGRQSTRAVQKEVAQLMIEACAALIKAKPTWAESYRVVAWICLPNMHSSEICIFLDEAYFRSKVNGQGTEQGTSIDLIADRSLSKEWGFAVPTNCSEVGVRWCNEAAPGELGSYASDHWMYGEVDA